MWNAMADPTSIELIVLGIGVVLTLVVAQVLVRSGRPFLRDSFERPETAASVTRLLVVLFHLVVLGVIALVATIDVTLGNPVETLVVRLGFVLLVLGATYGGTLLLLWRLRKRRGEQLLLDEMSEQASTARRMWGRRARTAAPGGSATGGSEQSEGTAGSTRPLS